MKLVSLKIQRSHRNTKLDRSHANDEAGSHQIHTYAELRQQIHDDLRAQHPDWIQPDGESPMCDSYEARLMQVLDGVTRVSKEAIVDPHRLLEQGLT
ncbi:MAG TPA: hypothetical protein VL136_07365 [Candidatus Babeliales bacterium]|jgi:hypothetical protein|nr:hypothetical protein [Candidatus Babeliales bacterium]